jgi:hypothetical protein
MPTPTAPMQWWGVVIDKFIPSLFSVDIIFFTSTTSEHSDSPWCEPITPLFSEIVRLSEAKKHACGRSIIHGEEDRRKVLRNNQNRALTIDACGQALTIACFWSRNNHSGLSLCYIPCCKLLI